MRPGSLFVSNDYLDPLEQCGCATPQTGWTRLRLDGADGRVPLYEKTHSWGEFVFDLELARHWHSAAHPYYPKLVCAIPFTPVPGPRLIADSDDQRRELARALKSRTGDYSSAHILFVNDEDRELLVGEGWLTRAQLRYRWHRRGAGDFEQFLDRIERKPRKNIRAERKRVADFEIRWQPADSFSAREWQRLYALYASTYAMRGQSPYLTPECLQQWAARLGDRMQIATAWRHAALVAMALFFVENDTLYGRHWGADADYHSLHFELCYYQGIEYCLQHGVETFDAGVQGGHRRRRGFDSELAYSMHWFNQPDWHTAIGRAYEQERQELLAVVQADYGDVPL